MVLLLTLSAPLLRAQNEGAGGKIAKIEIQYIGPATASDALIRANIRTKIGEPFSQTTVNDDVSNLYGTGYFFNVQIQQKISPEGITLIYMVQGKPLLTDIRFNGNSGAFVHGTPVVTTGRLVLVYFNVPHTASNPMTSATTIPVTIPINALFVKDIPSIVMCVLSKVISATEASF